MKRFLLKTFAFVALYLAVVTVLNAVRDPGPGWGNDCFLDKKTVFDEQEGGKKFNTLFIGSSYVYRQLDPALFDSVVNASGRMRMRSYNFGCPGTCAPESYLLCEKLVRNTPGIETVFLELTEVPPYNDNAYALRGNYWLDPREYAFAASVTMRAKKPNKPGDLVHLTSAFIQNMITLRRYGYEHELHLSVAGPRADGFYSLEDEASSEAGSELRKRREAFFKDTSRLAKTTRIVREGLQQERLPVNELHLQRLQQLIALCRGKNVQLYFFVCPRQPFHNILPLYEQLPEENRLVLPDPVRFPQLYAAKYSFDANHLDDRGAREMTLLLARDFAGKLNTEK